MLSIFRKYQRILYMIITFVIVISFSFFGAYNGMQNSQVNDPTVFEAVNGKQIARSELETLAAFIGTDNEDKILLGGRWGPNFLNDGVIKKDFLDTGLGTILAGSFLDQLKPDLKTRQQREKYYQTYRHPQAQFISAENAWNVFDPAINQKLSEMRIIENPASKEGFEARVNLFLEQGRFPPPVLRMVLSHQQKQYQWVKPDPNLNYVDLALFGYHTVEDWFGPRFVRLVSEFIINSAILAEQKGYSVSSEEVLADLYHNAEISFQQNATNPNLGAATPQQYFDEQLRRMGMDSSAAVKLWKQVMLFRRLFHDIGNSVWVDPYTIEQFQNFAKESVNGTLFQSQEGIRLSDFRDLQLFETYLSSIADRPGSGLELLDLPEKFKSIDQISEETPELLEKRYRLRIAKASKRDLQTKVGVRQTWEWQMKDPGWEKLKQQFPELGVKRGNTQDERYAALEGLDQKTRNRVDAFSREQIVSEHPEWLNQALSEAEQTVQVVGIRKEGSNPVIAGLSDPEKLISLLDRYPESQSELAMFSADNKTYYRIVVEESSPRYEVLTFAEAKKDRILDKLLDRRLQAVYPKMRENDPKKFQDQTGNWKPFEQVKFIVASEYFSPVLEAVKKYDAAVYSPDQKSKEMLPDYAATMRLFAYMRGLREQFKADPSSIKERVVEDRPEEDQLAANDQLQDQWKVREIAYHADRSVANLPYDEEEVYKLKKGEWTSVKKQSNGDYSFFLLDERLNQPDLAGTLEKVMMAQKEFANAAERVFMKKIVDLMLNKGALSLQYLGPADQSEE